MSYVICHLCRAKVSFDDNSTPPERCPKCQGKIPRNADIRDTNSAIELICPICLGRIVGSAQRNIHTCPICGQNLDLELARTLSQNHEAILKTPLLRLLKGESAVSIVADLQKLGISSDNAWLCIDRLIAELPFERYRAKQRGDTIKPAPTCDACGSNGELELYIAEWNLPSEEMKRYREGYAGFEGQFTDVKNYARTAIYCICRLCYKRSGKDDFADGYPRKLGYELKKIKKYS